EVDAEDARSRSACGNGRDRGNQVGLLGGDQRREVGRHAGLEERLAGGRESVGVRTEEVDAREPVHLQVDEAGHGDSATDAVEADGLDPAAVDRDVAGDEAAVDERSVDAQPHGPSAFRTTPPARASRSRAVEVSTPASSVTIATFASPSDASSAAATSVEDAPVASSTIRRTRPRSLSFVATTSTIRFP